MLYACVRTCSKGCILNSSSATHVGVGAEPLKFFPPTASNTGHLQMFQKQHYKNSKLRFFKNAGLPLHIYIFHPLPSLGRNPDALRSPCCFSP